jgi:hypothetical protein
MAAPEFQISNAENAFTQYRMILHGVEQESIEKQELYAKKRDGLIARHSSFAIGYTRLPT